MKTIKSMLEDLTFDDLRIWAGEKIFDRGRGYVDRVSQLSRTPDGALAAWVAGSDEYATMVRRNEEAKFDFNCTCPYDGRGPCKHVVAVLLAAAGQVKRDQDIPPLSLEDDLYLELFDDPFEEDEDLDDEKPAKGRSSQVASILAGKTREELLAMMSDLAAHHPEVERKIRESAQLERGQVDIIVRSLRKEIRNLTAEDAWFNPWKDEGNLPDYSHVEEQLRALLDKGHADAVFDLGEELWKGGVEQVGQSHDEGETAMMIAACLAIVMQALPRTTLSPSEQLLWLVEHELDDEYDLLGRADAVVNDVRYTEVDWGEVAVALEVRLQHMGLPKSGCFSETYRRERLTKWIGNAYRRSGQQQKVIPLLEQEADRCRNYETLVKALLETGERDKARRWCIEGFNKTLKEYAGIADGLQKRLRQMADEEGRHDLAAAYLAEDFFERPSRQVYTDLRQAAEKVQLWPMVRDGVFAYLQTGQRPATGSKGKNAWPLPEPEVKRPRPQGKPRSDSFPSREMLIEIALLEQRLDDAVEIYRELSKTRRWGWAIDEELAQAVAASHPEVALQIWKNIADRLIGQVKPKAYQDAAVYLRRMRKVYENTGHFDDWKALIMRLRTEHKAKRRLQEVLDGLEKNRKIID